MLKLRYQYSTRLSPIIAQVQEVSGAGPTVLDSSDDVDDNADIQKPACVTAAEAAHFFVPTRILF